MRKKLPKLLVTGGAGFIGSEFVRQAVGAGYPVIVVDKLTYAGDLERLKCVKEKFKFYKADICDKKAVAAVLKKENPRVIVHFAAESHVDRSIINASEFLKTNIEGTQILLDLSKKYKINKFIHISTDEVYGDIERGRFCECFALRPNSPYAASKAGADLLVKAYVRTYKFPAIIVRPSNNYGPWQYPEKLIPLMIVCAMRNKKLPVYGRGLNVREWLYVSDCAGGILRILKKGKIGAVYNLGSQAEKKNIDTVKGILKILGKPNSLIEFVKDRPGHDLRYALDSSKVKRETGWQAKVKFNQGLSRTVKWYVENKVWVNKHYSKELSIKF